MTVPANARPVHARVRYLLLVAAGGMAGAAARSGLGLALPAPGGWPLPTLIINLAGALALGLLLEALVRRGRDTGRRRLVRLLVGTGFLGAFTTYSTLAVDAVRLLEGGRVTDASLYLAASLFGGAMATFAGIWAGSALARRMEPAGPAPLSPTAPQPSTTTLSPTAPEHQRQADSDGGRG